MADEEEVVGPEPDANDEKDEVSERDYDVEGDEAVDEQIGRRKSVAFARSELYVDEDEEASGHGLGEGQRDSEAAEAAKVGTAGDEAAEDEPAETEDVMDEELDEAGEGEVEAVKPNDVDDGHCAIEPKASIRAVVSGFFLELGDEEEEQEVEEESTESAVTMLDRDRYYALYIATMETYGTNKRLNNFLHKKMGDYFKKRKMEHVLREMAEHVEEAVIKYGLKLDQLSALIDLDKNQRHSITTELRLMKQLQQEQFARAENSFKDFLAREKEIGTGLISTKTGKAIPDKAVDRLIQTQRSKAKELQDLRLMHIKIRNAVAEKHAAIKAMDRIGDNYTLIEFEQLKIENQSHADKIEEREEDLARLRRKCSGAIQCLAHVREKSTSVEINIKLMKDSLMKAEDETTEMRERMNELKQQRDFYRLGTQRMREENGLMTKDKLLMDMEDAMVTSQELEKLLQQKRDLLEESKEQLAALRENLENEKRRRRALEATSMAKNKKKSEVKKKHRTRPTIAVPVIDILP